MSQNCPFCGEPVPHHRAGCRVPGDLDRFERINALLEAANQKPFLRQNLMRHLVWFGRCGSPLAQGRDA